MQKLTQIEIRQAAASLIEWFNSQEIGRDDANLVMSKVWAKILSGSKQNLGDFTAMMDAHTKQLCNDIAERVARGK